MQRRTCSPSPPLDGCSRLYPQAIGSLRASCINIIVKRHFVFMVGSLLTEHFVSPVGRKPLWSHSELSPLHIIKCFLLLQRCRYVYDYDDSDGFRLWRPDEKSGWWEEKFPGGVDMKTLFGYLNLTIDLRLQWIEPEQAPQELMWQWLGKMLISNPWAHLLSYFTKMNFWMNLDDMIDDSTAAITPALNLLWAVLKKVVSKGSAWDTE